MGQAATLRRALGWLLVLLCALMGAWQCTPAFGGAYFDYRRGFKIGYDGSGFRFDPETVGTREVVRVRGRGLPEHTYLIDVGSRGWDTHQIDPHDALRNVGLRWEGVRVEGMGSPYYGDEVPTSECQVYSLRAQAPAASALLIDYRNGLSLLAAHREPYPPDEYGPPLHRLKWSVARLHLGWGIGRGFYIFPLALVTLLLWVWPRCSAVIARYRSG